MTQYPLALRSGKKSFRPTVLVVSMAMPQPAGTGMALRLEAVLKALSRRFNVHLVLLGDLSIPADLAIHVRKLGVCSFQTVPGPYHLDSRFAEADAMPHGEARLALLKTLPVPPQMRFATQDMAAKIDKLINHLNPDAVHVVRSDLLPCLLDLSEVIRERTGKRPLTVLDIDDNETEALPRMAQVLSDRGFQWGAEETRLVADQIGTIYQNAFPLIDRICICSERDRERMQSRYPGTLFQVLSNIAPTRMLEIPPSRRTAKALRLLFVGHLAYLPNIDAIELLVDRILPEIRRRTERSVVLEVVGRKASATLAEHWRTLGIELHCDSEDLTPHYARADVVALPLRSAGGTRIKILEAFSYGVPVVSTTIGAEGLEIETGQHAMIVDTIEAMAEACVALTEGPKVRAKMVAKARELVRQRYGWRRLDLDVSNVYASLLVR